MNFLREYHSENASALLRVGVSLVFLWFGFNQVFFTEDWIAFLPDFVNSFSIKPTLLILANGTFEIIFGFLLLIGLFTKVVSFLLSLHLLSISISLGYNPTAIRDFGLALATFSVFLNGPDKFTLDHKRKNT